MHSGNPLEQQWAPDGQQSSYCPAPASRSHFPPGWRHNCLSTAVPALLTALTDIVSLPAHSPFHEPAAFVGFLGGSWWEAMGQPDGAEPILTSGLLHKAQQPQPMQPSENSEETPTGRVTAAQRSPGTSREETRLGGLAESAWITSHPSLRIWAAQRSREPHSAWASPLLLRKCSPPS